MNAYDTGAIISLLEERGSVLVGTPEEADCIIVNTCSVREHAEQRAIGRLHDLSRHTDAAIVVCGCMAQRLGPALLDLVPAVRGVVGTTGYADLPDAIDKALESGARFSVLKGVDEGPGESYAHARPGPVSRYVSITRGCENYCTYCIVPYLRGKLRSRDADSIIREIKSLVSVGAKEVTLLGQNVIAYRHGHLDFTGLVDRILGETAVTRLRFLTSHPRDIGTAVFKIMAREPRLCSHVHLPVQSGSNRILRMMNRGYTREDYLETIRAAREIAPGIGLTTDIIVGFPSESDSEFHDTLDLVRAVRFDSAFTFQYSARNGTAASAYPDDVPWTTKRERLHVLNAAVQAERANILSAELGREVEILLDGTAQKGEYRFLRGRTPQFRNVIVPRGDLREGDIVRVILKRLANYTFVGEPAAP